MSLYDELKKADVQTDHHESDLYFKKSVESLVILEKWPQEKSIAKSFRSQIDGEIWIEVPFAFVPF